MRAVIILISMSQIAADWPQFLGPDRNSSTKDVVKPWTAAPRLLWKQPVGMAHASLIIAGGKVYAFYQSPSSKKDADIETLAAFDASSGVKQWEKSYERGSFTPPFGKGPRSTPCVANGVIVTIDGTGQVWARDAASGEEKWHHDALKTFNAKNLFFGTSTSPMIVDSQVVMMTGGPKAGIAAWNVVDGKVAWTATNDTASYSSPVLVDGNLVFLTGSHVRALNAKGQELWAFPFKDRLNESSTMPVQAGDLIIASSVTAGSVALRVKNNVPEQVWKNDKLTCYFSTPVVIDKTIYMINGAATLVNPSITLRAVDLDTGTVLWEKEKVGRYHAALIRTGDNKLLMLDDNGSLTLFNHGREKYDELARSKVCGVTWAHPALVDGKLYLRDETTLYCFEMK